MPIAKKKTSSKKKTVKANKGKEISLFNTGGQVSTELQDELASDLSKQKENAPKVSGDNINLKATGFFYGDNNLGASFNAVILGYSFFNADYGDTDYDPNENIPPICFAVGESQESMRPVDSIPTPLSEECSDCAMNKYHTAKIGKGKHCKNYIRIAVIHEDDLSDDGIPKVCYMKLPPTAHKSFSEFLTGCNEIHKVPTYAVGVSLSIAELPMGFSVDLELIGTVPLELIKGKIKPLVDPSRLVLLSVPDFESDDVPKGKKKSASKKKSGKKAKY